MIDKREYLINKKEYCIFKFSGILRHSCKENRMEKMTLKTCLAEVFNTSWDKDTKGFFEHDGFMFDSVYYTIDQIIREVENGMSIFPVSKGTDIDTVKKHIAMGLIPVFMKYRDFQELKKDYKEYI